MSRRRALLLVLTGLAGALLTLTHLDGRSGPRRAAAPDASSIAAATTGSRAAEAARRARPARSGRAWDPGLQYVYAFDLDQLLRTGATSAGDATVRLVLGGEVTATVVDAVDGGAAVEYQLDPARLAIASGDGKPADAAVQAAALAGLRQPFFVTHADSGAVVALHVEPELDALAQLMIRNLVESSQLVLPRGTPATWTVDERDATGAYQASYRRLAGDELEKVRLAYTQLSGATGLEPIADGIRVAPRGATRSTLDERRWPASLTARLGVRVTADDLPVGDGELTLTLRALRHGWAKDRVGRFAAERGRLVAMTPGTSPKDVGEVERLRQVLGGADLATLIADLRGLPAEPDARGRALALTLERLRALFVLDPQRALETPALIGALTARDVYSPMLGALSAAGTDQSAQALARISADPSLGQAVRVDAVAALGVVARPDATSLQALDELTRSEDVELRTTAALALGTTAGTLHGRGDPAGEQALERLLAESAGATDPAQRALLLAALANTRSPRILGELEAALRSPSIEVRQAAVTALRLITDPRADRLIADAMAFDPEPEVRRAAIFAARFRTLPPLLAALTAALTADPVDAVRLDAVRLLGERRGSMPEAIALLSSASQRDRSPEVRRVAAAFVAAAPS